MIISPQSLDTNLSQLLAEVKSGSMQLPEFQRDWTWDDNRIRGIIASLSQGYPMGAIMRLQYGNPDIQFKYRTITGVKGVSVKPEHLILDGQQRLTSIYQATSSKEPVSTKTEKGKAIKRYYYLSMEKCLDDDEDRFDAVLSIPEDRKIKENFDRDVKLDLSTREYEYCEKMGIKRERYNSIINKTPILPATNRSIGGNAPSEYLGAILKKVDGLTENELQARVESHFINYAELKADDFNGYFIDRAKSLLNLIEKAMNKPVTDRDAENTLDQFGASLA